MFPVFPQALSTSKLDFFYFYLIWKLYRRIYLRPLYVKVDDEMVVSRRQILSCCKGLVEHDDVAVPVETILKKLKREIPLLIVDDT